MTSAIANAKSEAIADADSKLADKANTTDVYAKTETYSQTEIDELLEGIQAGSSESAASVKTQLDAYKKVVNAEIWGNEAGTGDSRIDALEAVGAQANVLESVVAAESAKLTVSAIVNKTITIDDSAIQALITTAQNKANDAATAASNAQATADANAQNIQTNANDISNLKTLTGEHTTKISALELADSTHAGEFQALSETVTTHGTDIAGLKTGKADTTVTDALAGRITTNENAIKTLNETTIPGINGEIAKKADADKVYTKSEINAITGTVAEGKTLVDMIADAQSEATYDDTQIKADIAANAKAITDLTNGAVKDNTDAIAALTQQVGNVSNIMNFVGAKDELPADNTGYESGDVIIVGNQEYVFDGTNWQAFGDASVNGALISALDTRVKTNEDAIAAINHADTGILATSKSYTDSAIAALQASIHGVDDDTIKLNENKVYVAKVSTDILVQGSTELIFSAGNASGYNTQA